MSFKLIVAVANNQTIGRDNKLPWHLPQDLAFFKKTTQGHPIVMGRKTWESIGKALPNRLNIVLTKNSNWVPNSKTNETLPFTHLKENKHSINSGIAIANSLEQVLASFPKQQTLFLIGGETLYHHALENDLVDEIILTEINRDFEGDAVFPNWNKNNFSEVSREHNPETNEHAFSFDYVRYVRI